MCNKAEIDGGPLSKLCVTPPFSINFRCQIKNQVSDYRLLGASSYIGEDVFVYELSFLWKGIFDFQYYETYHDLNII
jgi:hypothetical protein